MAPTSARRASGTPEISLGVLLFLPYRHLEDRILAVVVEAGHPITLTQARLFQRVDHSGSRLTDLARAAQMSKQTAGFLVDQLEAAGYLRRVPDPTDGRARLIVVTRLGHDVIEIATREQRAIESQWREILGDADYRQLEDILGRLRDVTDPFRP